MCQCVELLFLVGLYGVEEEFLLGPGILVKPVLEVR
jgi:hypothetical protein